MISRKLYVRVLASLFTVPLLASGTIFFYPETVSDPYRTLLPQIPPNGAQFTRWRTLHMQHGISYRNLLHNVPNNHFSNISAKFIFSLISLNLYIAFADFFEYCSLLPYQEICILLIVFFCWFFSFFNQKK